LTKYGIKISLTPQDVVVYFVAIFLAVPNNLQQVSGGFLSSDCLQNNEERDHMANAEITAFSARIVFYRLIS
jgi:hypothetical protein